MKYEDIFIIYNHSVLLYCHSLSIYITLSTHLLNINILLVYFEQRGLMLIVTAQVTWCLTRIKRYIHYSTL